MKQLTALVKKYKGRNTSMLRLACGAVSGKTIDRTPRLSGSLVNSWTANNGEPVARNVDISGANPTPVRNNTTAVVNSLKAGDTFSFANGQPYARRIEYEGWSSKAPSGMRDVSVAEWQSIVNQAIRDAK